MENKKEEPIVPKYIINQTRKTIKNKYSELDVITLNLLINEAIESYNEYIKEKTDFNIFVTKFLIFYISKKIENNLSKQDLMDILRDNENVFITSNRSQKSALRKKKKENSKEINQNIEEIVNYANLAEKLHVRKPTFHHKYIRLLKKTHSISREIILKGTCDYYYIKYQDKKLLELMSKISCSYRDYLLLEIVLLRMEQVLTHEEAYEIAVKNFENGTSLLYSKYGDSYEGKKQDIYSKK